MSSERELLWDDDLVPLFAHPDLDDLLEDHQQGQVTLDIDGDDYSFIVEVRTDMSWGDAKGIHEWARMGALQVLESRNPEANGW